MTTAGSARARKASKQPAPSTLGDNWEAALIGRWRGGTGTERLALDFAVPLSIVESLVKGQIRRREARPSDFDDVTARMTPARANWESKAHVDEDCAAGDAAHVERVLAQGGFPRAVTLQDGNTVMAWPDLQAARRAGHAVSPAAAARP